MTGSIRSISELFVALGFQQWLHESLGDLPSPDSSGGETIVDKVRIFITGSKMGSRLAMLRKFSTPNIKPAFFYWKEDVVLAISMPKSDLHEGIFGQLVVWRHFCKILL